MKLSCDLFCHVVDNFGDAGVCWRLARQLAAESGWSMRLWIDDLRPLACLHPGIDPTAAQQLADGVEIRQWVGGVGGVGAAPAYRSAQVVIEAFGCDLPESYLVAMAGENSPPVWINLEYLSAESWVLGCHGMASPHARLPLTKHFFFPGLFPGTGGLLRDPTLAVPPAPSFDEGLRVTLFAYNNPALPDLLDTWANGAENVQCQVADGLPRQQVAAWLGADFAIGNETQRGRLRLQALPFLAQNAYDGLLTQSHLNFVRGEDSFVRAQWAERPFVWQIYPQVDDAHRVKLDAFLAHYGAGLDVPTRNAVLAFWQAWNGGEVISQHWPAFRAQLPRLARHARPWASQLQQAGNLAANLAQYCQERI